MIPETKYARLGGLHLAYQAIVSSTVRYLVVGSGVTFDDRGRHQLKGVLGEWQVLAVVCR